MKIITKETLLSIFAIIAVAVFSGCKTNVLNVVRDTTEALTSPLISSDMADAVMPDPTQKTAYDNDFENMMKHYAKYVENYALMAKTLAMADNQTALANKISAELESLKANEKNFLANSEILMATALSAKPSEKKLNSSDADIQKAKVQADAYASLAEQNFKQALAYARAISSLHYADFETKYDKTTKETLKVGPAYKLPAKQQDNMNRIDDIANKIQAKNGEKVISNITEEVNSWFTSDETEKK